MAGNVEPHSVSVGSHSSEANVELRAGQFAVRLLRTGASIRSVIAPDRAGQLDEIVLGHPRCEDYLVRTTSVVYAVPSFVSL